MLADKRILIVEDEWLLADHLDGIVTSAGAVVIGPMATVSDALGALVEGRPLPDAATLNVKLVDEMSYAVADRLNELGIPFTFISANRSQSLPDRFRDSPLLAKPFTDAQVRKTVERLFA